MIEDLKVDDQPMDRLTRLCKIMTDALEKELALENDEASEVRGIIFLNDEEMGGIEMFGYEDTASGLAALLIHMKALFAAIGKPFGVMTDKGMMLMEDWPPSP